MTVKLGASSFLLCNVYMPTYQSVQMSYIQDISDVYNDLKALINESSEDHVIIGGNFNTSFNKSGYNTNSLLEFITSEQLMCGLHYEKSAVKFTFESKANGSRSIIDHFMFDMGLMSNVTKYESQHDHDNFSDHCPVIMQINIPVVQFEVEKLSTSNHLLWHQPNKFPLNNYKSMLDSLLKGIKVPNCATKCNLLQCIDENHSVEINKFYNNIMQAYMKASEICIPQKGIGVSSKQIPGWSEHIEPYRQTSIFWHNLWKDNGGPATGWLAVRNS